MKYSKITNITRMNNPSIKNKPIKYIEVKEKLFTE